MTDKDKELLADCNDILATPWLRSLWPIATELKRRLTEPSEREKALVTVARFIRDDCSHHSNDTDTSYEAMLTEALAAYEEGK